MPDCAHTVYMTPSTYHNIEVCVDCYFAHHHGVRCEAVSNAADDTVMMWFAGESDEPADREPLNLVADEEVTDNTDSETGEGITTFSSSPCEGCGSMLGGARYRLAAHERA